VTAPAEALAPARPDTQQFVLRESTVDSFTHAINSLLDLVIEFGNLIVGGLITFELWVRDQLAQLGLSPPVETVVMVALAALLIVVSLRLFGGLIRVAVVLLLILIAAHILLPILPH
jgi:hypothetical protein